jgi:hypothetical protein
MSGEAYMAGRTELVDFAESLQPVAVLLLIDHPNNWRASVVPTAWDG